MQERKKIVLVGAGSAVFTQGLVADFIVADEMGPIELALVDIDAKVLSAITTVVQKMVDVKKADIVVQSSTEIRDVLRGADVVVTTIAVGGRRAWEQDVFIPRKYGIYQPVGDTTMPGGISRALRMIPVMVGIAEQVAELCPDALFINYSNPMTPILKAVQQKVSIPMVGLCHGVTHVEDYLSRFLGDKPGAVTSFGVGLNHLTFLHDLRYHGQPAGPAIQAVLKEQKAKYPEGTHSGALGWMAEPEGGPLYCDEPFSWSVYERYGALPAVLDRHVTEFFPERFRTGEYYGHVLGVDAFSFERVVAEGDTDYDYLFERAAGTRPLDEHLFHRTSGEHEKLVEILKSYWNDEKKVFYTNVTNRGAVPNLPAAAVLEMPTVVGAKGFYPLYVPDFPETLASILRKRMTVIDFTVEAALTGNVDTVVEALLADGSVNGTDQARQLAMELLEAHAQHLPQFSLRKVTG